MSTSRFEAALKSAQGIPEGKKKYKLTASLVVPRLLAFPSLLATVDFSEPSSSCFMPFVQGAAFSSSVRVETAYSILGKLPQVLISPSGKWSGQRTNRGQVGSKESYEDNQGSLIEITSGLSVKDGWSFSQGWVRDRGFRAEESA